MNYILYINFLVLFPTFVISCKSKTPEPVKEVTCPDGFWKVPDGWKCMRKYWDKDVECANDDQCMNYAYLCTYDQGEINCGASWEPDFNSESFPPKASGICSTCLLIVVNAVNQSS